jgi:predicted dehydrogenase
MKNKEPLSRRRFLAASSALPLLVQAAEAPLRVAVIGHTGRGNYGHGLDTVWLKVPGAKIVAAADADAKGLAKELKRLKIDSGFADYREMLQQVKPDIVAICPRHTDQRHHMAIATAEAGAKGIYIEKPFCRTPGEADAILAACAKHDTRIAIAHRNRYHPVLPVIDRMIAEGQIGKLLEIRGRGKGDRRGGGEDLWVLGSHVMNLIHYFGGKPLDCSAAMLQDGRPVTATDVKPGAEGLGPLAANEIHARYRMERGVTAYFDSIANDDTQNAGFGLQLIGSKGVIHFQMDIEPLAYLVPGNPFQPVDKPRPWVPISTAGPGKPEPRTDIVEMIHHHGLPARDLIASIEAHREPICNAGQAAMTVEMICAVFASHQQGGRRVDLPLVTRDNALTRLR